MLSQLSLVFKKKPLCQTLNYSRSTLYYQSKPASQEEVKTAIEKVLKEFPTYGYRRVTKQLQRFGWNVNHKRIARLLKEMGLLQVLKKRKCRTTNSEHSFLRYPNRVEELNIEHPEQVWVADITYIRLKEEFIYLAVVMDVFTRGIRGWNLSRSLDHFLSMGALEEALKKGVAEYHHSDQGVQYAASEYVHLLEKNEIQISMANVGCPEENGYAERLMRTIKEEEVALSEYKDFADAYSQIGEFIMEVYMKKRIHSSLGYLTPSEFEEQYWGKQQNN